MGTNGRFAVAPRSCGFRSLTQRCIGGVECRFVRIEEMTKPEVANVQNLLQVQLLYIHKRLADIDLE
jgi:hypothetical protein